MSSPEFIAEDRHGRILAELAGLSLELARDLQARALAAETVEEASRLAMSFQRVSRGLRQTLALELKVARYRDEAAREAEGARVRRRLFGPRGGGAPAHAPFVVPRVGPGRRSSEIRDAIEPLIWREHEADEDAEGFDGDFDDPIDAEAAQALQARFDAWLDLAEADPDFTVADLDSQLLACCRELGLDASELYEPEPDEPDGEGEGPEKQKGVETVQPAVFADTG